MPSFVRNASSPEGPSRPKGAESECGSKTSSLPRKHRRIELGPLELGSAGSRHKADTIDGPSPLAQKHHCQSVVSTKTRSTGTSCSINFCRATPQLMLLLLRLSRRRVHTDGKGGLLCVLRSAGSSSSIRGEAIVQDGIVPRPPKCI